jgi:serine acetyltransferase
MMTDLKKMTVSADASLRRIMEVIDSGARQMALGAIVTKDVPPGTTVVGNPAKPFSKA